MSSTSDKKMSEFEVIDTAHIKDTDYIPVLDKTEPITSKQNKRTLVNSLLEKLTGTVILQRLQSAWLRVYRVR
jgi:hypothetical protein